MSEHVDDLIAAGLYDPADHAAAERLELFVFLLDEIGASIPELVQADEEGGLLSFAAFRTLRVGRDGLTFAEAARARRDRSRHRRWRCGAAPGSPIRARSNAGSAPRTSRCSVSSDCSRHSWPASRYNN